MNSSDAGSARYWDDAFLTRGQTGWADRLVYRYDQPLRRRAVAGFLRAQIPSGLAGATAVDVGCGTGDFTATLRRAGARVVAFDLSGRVLAAAHRVVKAMGPGVQLCRASATAIPVSGGSARVVMSITVLQHVVGELDLARALSELRRVLRDDGLALVLELAPEISAAKLSADRSVIERPPSTWRRVFASAGLEVVAEGVYPQLGITVLRELARAIDRLRGGTTTGDAAASGPTGSLTLRRRILRVGFWSSRAILLALCWPIDYLCGLQMPARYRYYRLWALRPSRGVQ